MPDVVLTRPEADHLPAVCMVCGNPATTWVDRKFMTHDPVVSGPSGFLEVFAIRLMLATASTPTFTLRTSFCSQHRHYWLIRSFLVFGGLAGLFAVIFGGLAVVIVLMVAFKVDAPWLSCCAIVPVLLFLIAWIIPVKLLMAKAIRARITDTGLLLRNVGDRYVTAIQAMRRHP